MNNLLTLYQSASQESILEGFHWYESAHRECEEIAEKYHLGIDQVCGVIAAISPGLAWEENIPQAKELIFAWKHGHPIPMVGVYGRTNRDKAIRILDGGSPREVLGGPKVLAFYENILNPHDPDYVCIDRHALSAWKGTALNDVRLHTLFGRPRTLRKVQQELISAARQVGLTPNRFQAIVWIEWRKRHDGPRNDSAA